MTDSGKLSRRDWFRLRPPKHDDTPTAIAQDSDGVAGDGVEPNDRILASDGLQPIAHPPNHDGMDINDLPPMREAVLSEQQVVALFADIATLATDVLLMQRSTGSRRATSSKADAAEKLQLARAALLDGSIPRVQIRYRWQNSLWIDTLKSGPQGVHIVRISHSADSN